VPNGQAGYHRKCGGDGDDCWWTPNGFSNWNSHYACDSDGDNCRWTSGYGPQYWRSYGDEYGAPFAWYQAAPPDRYTLAQRRDWLLKRRQVGYTVLQRMRARRDVGAQRRMEGVIANLNSRLAQIDRRMGY